MARRLDITAKRTSDDSKRAHLETVDPVKRQVAAALSERKRAEDAIREIEARVRAREELLKIFVKSVPAGVAMLDREMRYLQVSDRSCVDYGVDGAQILGRSHYAVFQDLPERWKEVHRRALAGETVRAEEDRWDRKDGTVWVQ